MLEAGFSQKASDCGSKNSAENGREYFRLIDNEHLTYLLPAYQPKQTKSPKLSHSPQPPNLGDPAEHLSETSGDSLEAMSEGDVPSPFARGSRTRASLPVVRSTNQTKERSL
ncbi:hypothetical protein STEG23_036229, partial [Scotinomys teguina]